MSPNLNLFNMNLTGQEKRGRGPRSLYPRRMFSPPARGSASSWRNQATKRSWCGKTLPSTCKKSVFNHQNFKVFKLWFLYCNCQIKKTKIYFYCLKRVFRKECRVQMNLRSVTPEQLEQVLDQVFCLLLKSFWKFAKSIYDSKLQAVNLERSQRGTRGPSSPGLVLLKIKTTLCQMFGRDHPQVE